MYSLETFDSLTKLVNFANENYFKIIWVIAEKKYQPENRELIQKGYMSETYVYKAILLYIGKLK